MSLVHYELLLHVHTTYFIQAGTAEEYPELLDLASQTCVPCDREALLLHWNNFCNVLWWCMDCCLNLFSRFKLSGYFNNRNRAMAAV